ncbi:MAG: hypothetical protein WD690_18735 [Vicinamibacterales bacterium]
MIAHVQLTDFFIAVERAARPDLANRPLIIGAAVDRGTVAAASVEARARGVHTGMRTAAARALAPDAVCVSGAIERYLEVSAQIDERLRRITHTIEWTAVDEAWLLLDGGARATRPSIEDVREAVQRDFGIAMAIGAGATKAVAAIASHLMSPAGMLIVLPGYEARLLAPIAIERMPGLGDDAAARLRARGITTLGDLAALDEEVLHDMLGRGGRIFARHALGLDDRPVAADEAAKGIVRAARFGSCGATQARGAIMQLSDQAAAALRRSGHAARQIRLRVRDTAGERIRVGIVPPVTSSQEIGEHVDLLARRLLHPGRELIEAAVSLTALCPIAPQLELFATRLERAM